MTNRYIYIYHIHAAFYFLSNTWQSNYWTPIWAKQSTADAKLLYGTTCSSLVFFLIIVLHHRLNHFEEFKESKREADFMSPKTSQCHSDLEIINAKAVQN